MLDLEVIRDAVIHILGECRFYGSSPTAFQMEVEKACMVAFYSGLEGFEAEVLRLAAKQIVASGKLPRPE